MTGTTRAGVDAGVSKRIEPFATSVWPWVDEMSQRNPNAVFFGGGVPPTDVLPVARLRYGSEIAWQDDPSMLLYGEVRGYKPLREFIARRMALRGAEVDPAQIMLTNGAQQGIDLVARVFVDPGDIVLAEAPTFMDALRVFRSHEAEVVGVPIDEGGIIIEALVNILDSLPKPPKFLYTIPTYQNPMGVTMPLERRQHLVALARERGLVLVEDDPYGELTYDGEAVPTLRALDPDVIFLGTFSKILAPGLRVGWIVAPDCLMPSIFNVKEGTDIHNERVMPRAIYHAAEGFLDEHIAQTQALYRARRDAMVAALEEYMPPGVEWIVPAGGFFLWVTLPERYNTDVMLPDATDRGIIFLPSSWFYPDTSWTRSMRLNFSAHPEARIREAMRALGEAIAAYE